MVIAMEILWVYPWLIWIGSWNFVARNGASLSLASIIIVMAISTLVTRLCIRQKWPEWLIQLIIVGIGLMSVGFVLGIEFSGSFTGSDSKWFINLILMEGRLFANIILYTIILAYLWWRGMVLGNSTPSFNGIYGLFGRGLLALIVLIISWHVNSNTGGSQDFIPRIANYIIAFFFLGLMSIALCHLYLIPDGIIREEASGTSDWRWLVTILGIICGIMAIGIGIASFFSREIFIGLKQGIGMVYAIVVNILEYIFVPISYVVGVIYILLRFIVELIWKKDLLKQDEGEGEKMAEAVHKVAEHQQFPPEIILVLKWLVLAIIVGVVIYFLARAIFGFRKEQEDMDIEELHESLWSWDDFKADLRLWLDMMAGMLPRRQFHPSGPLFPDNEPSGTMDIRQIYRRLLHEGAQSGIERGGHETPLEYSNRLGRSIPEGRKYLSSLTNMYMSVRYGEILLPKKKVEKANSMWQTMRELIRSLRNESLTEIPGNNP